MAWYNPFGIFSKSAASVGTEVRRLKDASRFYGRSLTAVAVIAAALSTVTTSFVKDFAVNKEVNQLKRTVVSQKAQLRQMQESGDIQEVREQIKKDFSNLTGELEVVKKGHLQWLNLLKSKKQKEADELRVSMIDRLAKAQKAIDSYRKIMKKVFESDPNAKRFLSLLDAMSEGTKEIKFKVVDKK